MQTNYLESIQKQFLYYKQLGDRTFDQLSEEDIFIQQNEDTNSIAVIVKHLHGNMMSRWTNFLTEDGEKSWRNRDGEFESDIKSKADMVELWESGWKCLFDTFDSLKPSDVEKIVYIRNQGHTVMEAYNRQLAHYPYHIGQIVHIAKSLRGEQWVSLSIPKGASSSYNKDKFSKEKSRKHFTDDL